MINEWSHRGGAIRRGLDELHFTRRRRGGARPGSTRGPVSLSPWLSPALHPALSPFVPYCSLPVQDSRPLCLGSLTSAVSLIRASQPLQQGVGAPGPGMAPDKQLETLVTESVISKGKAETNHREPGGTADNKSHYYWRPLHSALRPLPLEPRATMSPLHKASLAGPLRPPALASYQHRIHSCHLLH